MCEHSHPGTLSHHSSIILVVDVRTSFSPMIPQDLVYYPMILGFDSVVSVSKLLGIGMGIGR